MRTTSRRLIPAIVALALVVPAATDAAKPGRYVGKLYSDSSGKAVKGSKVTFRAADGKLRKFLVKGGTSSCVSVIGGIQFTFYPLSFEVPSAPIRNNRVDRRYVIREDGEKVATNILKGKFSGRRASGKLRQDGPSGCAAHYDWRAQHKG